MPETFNPSDFTVATAKPLPIVLLLDTSSSMDGDNIDALNNAVRRMLRTLTKQESQAQEYLVSIITFSNTTINHHSLDSLVDAVQKIVMSPDIVWRQGELE